METTPVDNYALLPNNRDGKHIQASAIVALLLLTVYFILVAYVILNLNSRIGHPPKAAAPEIFTALKPAQLSDSARFAYMRQNIAYSLETNIIERRYHQANTLLLSKMWMNFLGFITGMLLSFFGIYFCLGKNMGNYAGAHSSAALHQRKRFATAGVIFGFIGCVLMLACILNHNVVAINETPQYFNRYPPYYQPDDDGGIPDPFSNIHANQ